MSVALHHEIDGPPDAPVVVCTGSLGTSLAMWEPQVAALAGRYRIVRCDVRGHGRSPAPEGPYAIADLGGDLIALLDELGLGRVHLVGLSIGAMISLWVAAHAPQRVDRLIACATTARFAPSAADAYRERAAAVRAHGLAPIADAVLARWFTPDFAARRPEVIDAVRAGLLATPREGYAACCDALARLDLTAELPAIAAPTLVIAGERDLATPPEQGRAIADAVPGARMTGVPAAHLLNLEAPEAVTELIDTFLRQETR